MIQSATLLCEVPVAFGVLLFSVLPSVLLIIGGVLLMFSALAKYRREENPLLGLAGLGIVCAGVFGVTQALTCVRLNALIRDYPEAAHRYIELVAAEKEAALQSSNFQRLVITLPKPAGVREFETAFPCRSEAPTEPPQTRYTGEDAPQRENSAE